MILAYEDIVPVFFILLHLHYNNLAFKNTISQNNLYRLLQFLNDTLVLMSILSSICFRTKPNGLMEKIIFSLHDPIFYVRLLLIMTCCNKNMTITNNS